MTYKSAFFAEHLVAVVPHTEEAEHTAIQSDELLELVEVRRRLCCRVRLVNQTALGNVWINWCVLGGTDWDTL